MDDTYELLISGGAVLIIVVIFLKYFIHINNMNENARIHPIRINDNESPPPRYEPMPIPANVNNINQSQEYTSPPPMYNGVE